MINLINRKIHDFVSDKQFNVILSGSAWALSARIIATAMGMATSIITARFYGAEVMGLVAVLNSFLTLVTIFTVLGTGTSILRLIPEHIAKYSPASAFHVYRKTQYFVSAFSLLTGVLVFLASGFISGTIFSKPHMKFYFALASAFIIFKSLILLNTQALRGIRMIKVFAFFLFLPSLARLSILLALTVFYLYRDNPIYAMFGSTAITAIAGVWYMHRSFVKMTKPSDTVQGISIKSILAISLPMLMSATMTFVIGQTGIIVIGMLKTEADVGYFSIALNLATLTTFILSAVTTMAAPKFSELFHTDKMEELFRVAQKSTKLIFWTTTPILFTLLVFGQKIIVFFFGRDFAPAYSAMVFLVIGQFINSISGATGTFMNMTGNQKTFRNIVMLAACSCILLNIALIPGFGIVGSAIASMISMAFWNIAILVYIKKTYGKTIVYLPFIS